MKKGLMIMLTICTLALGVTGCTTKEEKNSSLGTENTDLTESSSQINIEADRTIKLGDNIEVVGEGAAVDNNVITITAGGTYSISGTLKDGQIVVNTSKEENVKLVLNAANITCSNNAPIYVTSAKNTHIILADGTENTITDGTSYTLADPSKDEPNAAIFCKDDLMIEGLGSLIVNANYNHGIVSKDDLEIESGNIIVNSVGDGIKGKDSVTMTDGNITINAGGDGIQASNAEEEGKGVITIEAGTLNITSGDDAINSTKSVVINGGYLTIAAEDDGIHSDFDLVINKGDINITKSYEGIEGQTITVNDGNIYLVSSDDGFNASDSAAATGEQGGPGQGGFGTVGNGLVTFNGGYIYVDANGDGLDANGSMKMTGGTVIVNGPIENNNGPLDYDGTFDVTGGLLIAAGSSGMAQAPSQTSTQNSIIAGVNSQTANTVVNISASNGDEVITFAPTKQYASVVVCSPKIKSGESYTVSIGGASTGTEKDGVYTGGKYSGGTTVGTESISGSVTQVGTASVGMGGHGGGMMPGGERPKR